MTIYNINLGIGWASSGVEYAQAYRASVFRDLGIPAKFIFTDMFQHENLEHLTANIGFSDDEIIWLYSYFTDIKIAPTTYPLSELENSFTLPVQSIDKSGNLWRYHFNEDFYANVSLYGPEDNYVQRVEYVSKGNLVRKDYYSYVKIFTEYYMPKDQKPQLIQRSFFNEDGSVAYEEYCEPEMSIFKFENKWCYGKEELVGYLLDCLALTRQDMILLDRATGIGQAVFDHKGQAALAVVIHAEHYNAKADEEDNILWNNYYEYQFTNADKVDAFIASTQVQKELLEKQFQHYTSHRPKIYAIPVGSLDKLRYPESQRVPYRMMTSSRLASEKHIDWLLQAVILAKKSLPQLTFDIYGEGGERNKLTKLISDAHAQDYIQLKGHQNLTEIYKDYALYLTASTSEGFGLTLLEAVGSGLPLIGLDVPYGNQTFISHGENGLLLERQEPDNSQHMAQVFAEAIVRYFQTMDADKAHASSYQKAQAFLAHEVAKQWQDFIKEVLYD
ncbi:accessory Sec system glycosyltransferase GtfA [Lactococcus ileimucosae]|uniref:accessory Sec system glycosyltransferase GtfA n=1 Tax=Lactococcus ileimucosae TaxID=2941329 RepID=UPI003519997A